MNSEIDFAFEQLADIFLPGWREDAACAPEDQDIFFEKEHEARAKAICKFCPVRLECLNNAVYYRDGGVRGGMNEKERQSVVAAHRRYALAFKHDLGLE